MSRVAGFLLRSGGATIARPVTRLAVTLVVAAVVTGTARAAWSQDAQTSAGDEQAIGEIGDAAREGPWMDGVSIERQEQARALFREGNALIKEAFFADAAARYQQALALWDHPAFHFNLAMAQRALDQPVAAHDSLGLAMRHGPSAIG